MSACLLALGWLGCASDRATRSPAPQAAIDQLHLLTTPVALNLDRTPGPDGFGARVYAAHHRVPKPVSIQAGTFEILMYDGLVKEADPLRVQPLRVWTYAASDLKPLAQETSVGQSYRFALPWGEARPTRDQITVIARLTLPGAPPVYSAASTILVSVK